MHRSLPVFDGTGSTRPSAVLRCAELRRSFGRNLVLDDVRLDLAPGRVLGLLGPNGAGKTTLLSILAGLLPPDSGYIWLDDALVDFDRRPEARRELGLMLGGRTLIDELRPPEYFDFMAAMFRASPKNAEAIARDLVARLQLGEHLGKPIKQLSAGTKKKVEFVGAVLHEPRVLILDEPFEAIDPPSVATLTAVTRDLVRARGLTAIVSSHILPYVRPLADDIQLLWRGKLYSREALDELAEVADAEFQTWRHVILDTAA